MPHQQAIDREVPPLHVLFRRFRIQDAVRMPPIAVTNIRAKRCHFHFQAIAWNQHHSELRAHRHAFRKQPHHLFWRRVRCHIVIRWFASKQRIAHAPAREQRLVSIPAQHIADRISQFPWCHAVIMRQLAL
jgi:hypothetical protein